MQGVPLSNSNEPDRQYFRATVERQFEIVRRGGILFSNEAVVPDFLPSSGVDLALTVRRSAGRVSALESVKLDGVDLYGESTEFFALGLTCWQLSRCADANVNYRLGTESANVNSISAILVRAYSTNQIQPTDSVRPVGSIRYSRRPLAGYCRAVSDLPSFGIREKERCVDGSDIEQAIILWQSFRGLNALGRCLMAFASAPLAVLDEIYFEHGHSSATSSVRRISYEAHLYKVGSFAGDSTFLAGS